MKYEEFSKGYITFLTQFQKEKTSPEEAQLSSQKGVVAKGIDGMI